MRARETIRKQIVSNYGVNLLYTGADFSFTFTDAIKELLGKIVRSEWNEYEIQDLLQFTCRATLESIYQINQYFQFNLQSEIELKMLYLQGIQDFRLNGSAGLQNLSRSHFLRLQRWFLKNQPEASYLFPFDRSHLQSKIICAEYSAGLQLKTLGLEISKLQEPILDIACGKTHNLINHLNEVGLDALGIDRNVEPNDHIKRAGWFNFDFEKDYWGTIISHLGFSNHFLHHHNKKDSLHQQFARAYMRILGSLKKGGIFYYVPALPFIETYLDSTEYSVVHSRVAGTSYLRTAVQRLK